MDDWQLDTIHPKWIIIRWINKKSEKKKKSRIALIDSLNQSVQSGLDQ